MKNEEIQPFQVKIEEDENVAALNEKEEDWIQVEEEEDEGEAYENSEER